VKLFGVVIYVIKCFQNVINKDSSLLKVLRTLCETGVFLIEGTPKEVGQIRKLAEKIGFIRLTHYGYAGILFKLKHTLFL